MVFIYCFIAPSWSPLLKKTKFNVNYSQSHKRQLLYYIAIKGQLYGWCLWPKESQELTLHLLCHLAKVRKCCLSKVTYWLVPFFICKKLDTVSSSVLHHIKREAKILYHVCTEMKISVIMQFYFFKIISKKLFLQNASNYAIRKCHSTIEVFNTCISDLHIV